MGRLTNRPGVSAAAARFLVARGVAETRRRGAEAEAGMAKLSEEEVKEILAYTKEELEADIASVKAGARNAQSIMGMMDRRLGYTVTKPEQRLVGDVSVQVVVNSMRKAYELPPESTTSSLPEKAGE
jgi:hypothetical protein